MEYKRVYALIVAAGSGKRMNIELPKQLLPYRGSTVLETSVRKFAEHEMIDDIVVVSPADGSLDKTYYQIMGIFACLKMRKTEPGAQRTYW